MTKVFIVRDADTESFNVIDACGDRFTLTVYDDGNGVAETRNHLDGEHQFAALTPHTLAALVEFLQRKATEPH